jgi:hypothetical protein
MDLSLILDIYTLCIFLYYPPLPWVWLELLITFVLTYVTYVASVEDPDFVAKDV